jgi:hypothetical protein
VTGVVELGNGYPYTNQEVLELVELATGKKANIQVTKSLRSYDNKEWFCKHPFFHKPKPLLKSIEEMVAAYPNERPRKTHVIELSYKHKLTHISSCLNCINLIDWIYRERKPEEPFVFGNGHAGLALYVVLEKYGFCDAEEMIKKHGVHPNRDMPNGIYVSSGSLGQAETVAVGLALADKNQEGMVNDQ